MSFNGSMGRAVLAAMMMATIADEAMFPHKRVGKHIPQTGIDPKVIEKHGHTFEDVMDAIGAKKIGVFTPNTGSPADVYECEAVLLPFTVFDTGTEIRVKPLNRSMMRKVKKHEKE